MMQAMYMQYAAAPHHKNQDYGVHRYLGGHKKIAAKEDVRLNYNVIGKVAVVVG